MTDVLFKIAKKVWFLSFVLLISLLVGGCKVADNPWIEKMLTEMEQAWIKADNQNLDDEGRKSAVTEVAKKYFPAGMPKDEAFKLLRELKAEGFLVNEYRHEGGRRWPDGEFNPYGDEVRRNFQNRIPLGVSEISTRKEYGRTRLIITKHVSLTIIINDGDGKIDTARAQIWTNSI